MMTIAHNWLSVNCDLCLGFSSCAVIYVSFRCGNMRCSVRGGIYPWAQGQERISHHLLNSQEANSWLLANG
jgi:hypothetical protein